ncbi:MAG: helix-turn-helix domain-containing protein [Planctomycetaceae bacterium]
MKDYEDVQVFTTGQVAKICQVAPRTVSKWFDTGRLEGYRIPGSQDRRIPRENLVQFMQSHGMPLGALAPVGPGRVLLIGDTKEVERQLQAEFPQEVEVFTAATAFEAGSLTTHMKPHCVVINIGDANSDMAAVAVGMRNLLGSDVAIVGLVSQGGVDRRAELAIDESFRVPVDAPLVAARVQALASRQAMKVR